MLPLPPLTWRRGASSARIVFWSKQRFRAQIRKKKTTQVIALTPPSNTNPLASFAGNCFSLFFSVTHYTELYFARYQIMLKVYPINTQSLSKLLLFSLISFQAVKSQKPSLVPFLSFLDVLFSGPADEEAGWAGQRA